jgi:2'-5' RNA ligase superfamily
MAWKLSWSWMVVAALALVIRDANAEDRKASPQTSVDRVIAIDVLLEPGPTMVAKAEGANAALRANYPEGYTLGREQVAHITLVHRFVREHDLPAIEQAVAKVASKERPLDRQLTATGFGYSIWVGLATTVINIDRTPELDRFAADIVKALEPFTVAQGTAAAFHTTRNCRRGSRGLRQKIKGRAVRKVFIQTVRRSNLPAWQLWHGAKETLGMDC